MDRPRYRGFTLADTLLGMAVFGVLLFGLQSAVMIAARSVPGSDGAVTQTVAARRSGDALAADLAYATRIVSRAAADVTFEVADRNGDGSPETIRYYWTGANQPLRRVYNGVDSVATAGVQEFALAYSTRSATTSEPTVTEATGAERRVAWFTGYTSAGTVTTRDFGVGGSNWVAQYFPLMDVPAGTTKIRFSRADLWVKIPVVSTADPVVTLHRSQDAALPVIGTQIGSSATVSRSGLSTAAYTKRSATFPADVTVTGVPADLYLVVRAPPLSISSVVRYFQASSPPADAPHMEWTTLLGAGWSPASSSWNTYDMTFELYGFCTTATTTTTSVTRHYLHTTGVTLRTSTDATARVQTAVRMLNEPEVTTP